MYKEAQNSTFQPSPEQIKFIEAYLDLDNSKPITEISKDTGVPRRTIYNWFEKEEFVDWLNGKKDELLNKSLMDRYRTAIRRAKAGDFQFSKLLFEMQGEYIQKTESRITQVEDGLENLTTEELIKEFEHDLDTYRASEDRPKEDGPKSKRAKKG